MAPPDSLNAIRERDAAMPSETRLRVQFGPTAAKAILDRRHLLAMLDELTAKINTERAAWWLELSKYGYHLTTDGAVPGGGVGQVNVVNGPLSPLGGAGGGGTVHADEAPVVVSEQALP